MKVVDAALVLREDDDEHFREKGGGVVNAVQLGSILRSTVELIQSKSSLNHRTDTKVRLLRLHPILSPHGFTSYSQREGSALRAHRGP